MNIHSDSGSECIDAGSLLIGGRSANIGGGGSRGINQEYAI